MKSHATLIVPASILAAAVITVASSAQQAAPHRPVDLKPIGSGISTHMSYLFSPSYRRLKQQMRSEPTDSAGWDDMRAEALLLAECGGLLTRRQSSNEFNPSAKADWPRNSLAVRKHATALYRAAEKQDFELARRSYASMTESCNACHKSEVALGMPAPADAIWQRNYGQLIGGTALDPDHDAVDTGAPPRHSPVAGGHA